jgi:glycosyltransferase involved in cell wall biosynthesis
MVWADECAAVIPCLNEGAAISALVRAVRPYLPKVIVVDDGSTDKTSARAAEAGAEIIRHARPRGKGAALRSGWKRAAELGFSWALTLDGDGQHAPADIPRLFSAAENGAVLVVGNRMAQPLAMPWTRRAVNRWMSRCLSRRAGRELPDSQCGFRLLRLDLLSGLVLKTNHFEIESEVLLRFLAAGHTVEFVPVQAIYKHEHSKIQPLCDTLRWFRWFWRS